MELDTEILNDFQSESLTLLNELELVVESLEDAEEFPAESLKVFSQKIDRIMGAAKTLLSMAPGHRGISFVATVSEMCKTMGYQAAALQKNNLVPIFAGFWADVVELLKEIFEKIDNETELNSLINEHSATLQKRLVWLAEKVAPNNEEEKQKVVALLKAL